MAVRIGDSEKIQALASQLSQFCDETAQRIQGIHQRFNDMPSDNSWADEIFRENLQRFEEHRNALGNAVEQLNLLQVQIGHLARKYEEVR